LFVNYLTFFQLYYNFTYIFIDCNYFSITYFPNPKVVFLPTCKISPARNISI